MAEAAVPAIKHILEHVPSPRPSASRACPLFVGIQGPQGIGKTTLTKNLVSWLSSEPYSLKTVVFSIDDLYYGHEALGEIAAAHPDNIFLQGRGLPGTHDVNLGSIVLERLKNINATNSFAQNDNQAVKIPSYDKSLHDGRGDRVPQDQWESIRGPIDVVILEGWCLGFYPISESALESRWERSREQREQTSSVSYKLEDIKILNENLKAYVRGWYSYLACFIKVSTERSNIENPVLFKGTVKHREAKRF
jgi:D-glycerate 3-kinase